MTPPGLLTMNPFALVPLDLQWSTSSRLIGKGCGIKFRKFIASRMECNVDKNSILVVDGKVVGIVGG